MKSIKVWVVLGGADGLGYAAVKYLVSNGQIVIALTDRISAGYPFFEQAPGNLYVIDTDIIDIIPVKKTLKAVTARYGAIDHIINNADYRLFTGSAVDRFPELQRAIAAGNGPTIKLIKALVPLLRKDPKGSLINLPPQLCLATVQDKSHADRLSSAMEIYLENLYKELHVLDCRLTFLQPGERLADFTTNGPGI